MLTFEDPFVNSSNVVNPFQVLGNVPNQYSIKATVKNRNSHINVYSGTFVSDLNLRASGFQGTIMEMIEMIIQEVLAPDFVLGTLPSLGRPNDYNFQPEDILVSFTNKNDFLIFNGDGANREVLFMTVDQLPQSYRPGDFGAPADFTFVSSQGDNYKVTYSEYGNFTVLVNGTRLLTFDYNSNIATYDTNTLEETVLDDDTKIYRTVFYTSVGITVLPSILPVDIVFAEGQAGLFYSRDLQAPATSQGVADYIYSLYNFNVNQKNYILALIRVIFPHILRSLYHILKIRNRDIFSVNNGFSTFVSFNRVGIQINLS